MAKYENRARRGFERLPTPRAVRSCNLCAGGTTQQSLIDTCFGKSSGERFVFGSYALGRMRVYEISTHFPGQSFVQGTDAYEHVKRFDRCATLPNGFVQGYAPTNDRAHGPIFRIRLVLPPVCHRFSVVLVRRCREEYYLLFHGAAQGE